MTSRDRPHLAPRAARHAIDIAVLGVPTRFEHDDPAVAEAVESSFGAWRRAGVVADGALEPLVVRLEVVEHGAGAAGDGTVVRHRLLAGGALLVHSAECVGVVDPARGVAEGRVDRALVETGEHFRSAVLEALTFALIAARARHPLHAAAVARGGHALLLAGPSGAGKSTLAYVAHAAGLELLSEDRVWVQDAPALRVWGCPADFRLVSRAAAQLDLASGAPSTRDGKTKLGVPRAADATWCPSVTSAGVCVLEARRASRPRIERLSRDEVVEALVRDVARGFDRFPDRHERVVAALAEPGGWRLVPSHDGRESLPLLMEMLGEA